MQALADVEEEEWPDDGAIEIGSDDAYDEWLCNIFTLYQCSHNSQQNFNQI